MLPDDFKDDMDKIIKIDGGISAESYLFKTQYLSDDNKLYCLGYIWKNKELFFPSGQTNIIPFSSAI